MSTYSADQQAWVYGDDEGAHLARSTRVIKIMSIMLLCAIIWSYFAVLDEVSTGTGKVVPIRHEQVIQSLEGGIVKALYVHENQIVEAGQLLAQLDPTMTESDVDESAAKYRAALAASARLTAEVNQTPLVFPHELDAYPNLVKSETDLYNAKKKNLEDSLRWMDESIKLAQQELTMSDSLSKIGAASSVEIIRLKRDLVDMQLKRGDTISQQMVQAREELAKANADVSSLSANIRGRSDSLKRLTQYSPVRGIVKNIEVTTIGGVIPPHGKLMDIIPLDDQLLIETRIAPRDIAFIHPGQSATVKISAYDYSIYGGLEGTVTAISPDTIRDEVNPETYYYRVYVQTKKDALINHAGTKFPIAPGMVATVDVHTGSKSVFDYLIKPFNKAGEALRER